MLVLVCTAIFALLNVSPCLHRYLHFYISLSSLLQFIPDFDNYLLFFFHLFSIWGRCNHINHSSFQISTLSGLVRLLSLLLSPSCNVLWHHATSVSTGQSSFLSMSTHFHVLITSSCPILTTVSGQSWVTLGVCAPNFIVRLNCPWIQPCDSVVFIYCVQQSPDGKYIACGAIDGIINIFDMTTGKLLHTLEGREMSYWHRV